MGATHLPSTEFDGTAVDDQLEAEAEAGMGEPGRAHGPAAGAGRDAGHRPVFSAYADKLDAEKLRGLLRRHGEDPPL